jgi:hypothetical protein
MQRVPAWLAAGVLVAAATPALAHGGTYQGGAGSGGDPGHQIPPDLVDRSGGETTWETWWTAHNESYVHLTDRLSSSKGVHIAINPSS